MKRLMVMILAPAALTAAYFGGSSRAQQSAGQRAFSKAAMVNLGVLYTKYSAIKAFKDDIESLVQPYRRAKEELENKIAKLQQGNSKPDGAQMVIECRRQLEDLETKYRKEIGKALEEKALRLNKEIGDKIRTYAAAHGYDLVISYGEPENPLPAMTSFRRKMAAVDEGGLVYAYAANGVDITSEVLRVLNGSYRANQPVKNETSR